MHQIKHFLNHVWHKLRQGWMSLVLLLLAGPALAQTSQSITLQNTGTTFFDSIVALFQDIIDFAGGPGVFFIIFISAVMAIGLWIFAPKQGSAAVTWLIRILVGGIIILNLSLLLTYLQSL